MKSLLSVSFIALLLVSAIASAWDGTVLISDTKNNRVIEVDSQGTVVWSKADGLDLPIDSERLPNGNTLVVEFLGEELVEVDEFGNVVWSYYLGSRPYGAERLENGNTLIADYDQERVIEIDLNGSIVWEFSTGLKEVTDAKRLSNGNTLITDIYNDRVIEVDPAGNTVWQKLVSHQPYGAERLGNGNTLVAMEGGSQVIEVDPEGNEVWSYSSGLYYPHDAQRLSNGNTLIADTKNHRVIEVDPAGTVLWTFSVGMNEPYDIDGIPAQPTYNQISGVVVSSGQGLYGVAVAMAAANGQSIAATATDPNGVYAFEEIPAGDYVVSIVTPMGFMVESETQDITVSGEDVICDFELTPVEMTYCQRSAAFWRHQVWVYLTGWGYAEVPQEEFCSYLDEIRIHFNGNPVNPVTLYEVEQPATQTDSLEAAYDLLNFAWCAPMVEKAERQLMALLLNVASGKLPQFAEISCDGRTVAQAITYCWDLITDGDLGNDWDAMWIAMRINLHIPVGAGEIPDIATPYYALPTHPVALALMQNYPNPVQEKTTIRYDLPVHSDVQLTIHNVQGHQIATLVDEWQPAGRQSITLDAERYPSGVYMYKLNAGDRVLTKRMTIVR